MSRRFTRLSLWLVFLLSSEVWAIGLGDIELDSALNEPLRAEIALLSATPDELAELKVNLASAETFERYGIDRPYFLQQVEFKVIDRGATGSVVEIRSRAPMAEPFLTFLIEATWSSGRLLREYTVLLDPPTYSPPAVQQPPAVEAPRRSTPSDSGRIERQVTPTPEVEQEPVAEPQPEPAVMITAPQPQEPTRSVDTSVPDYEAAPEPVAQPEPQQTRPQEPYSRDSGTDFIVTKGQTLWGVAAHLRPDSRLSMNQMMLAIFEANPEAFGGNINMMKAGASLRIPSADEIFQISRNEALSEVQRQHSSWGSADAYVAPDPSTQPSLTLVPPDEDPVSSDYDDSSAYEPLTREEEIETQIATLEAADVPNQQSLIEIRDSELAALRQELAEIRGEVYEPPVDEPVYDDVVADDTLADDTEADDSELVDPFAPDDTLVDEAGDDVPVDDTSITDDVETDTTPTNIISTSSSEDEGIVDRIIGFLTDWGIIIAALIVVAGGLLWFARRRGDDADEDESRPWERLDSEEAAAEDEDISATATIQAPISNDEAIVVVEQDSGVHQVLDETVEAPATDFAPAPGASTGSFDSLEDTFSSETAVNLDQSDPIAEADFHMAYGLYDQAADLINGALKTDSADTALLSKLCEIYFVWGNRDEFVGSATRLKHAIGDTDSADWNKIVIMGQQIAADHELFSGVEAVSAPQSVDLSFDDGGDDTAGALDMDFGAEGDEASGVIDFGAEFDGDADATLSDVDLDETEQSSTVEMPSTDVTAEMPGPDLDGQSPAQDAGTTELPSLAETLDHADSISDHDADATAEINLDELDLGVADFDETEVAPLGDFDETEIASLDDLDITGQNEVLTDAGISEALADKDSGGETMELPDFDPESTEVDESSAEPDAGGDEDATEFIKGIGVGDIEGSGMRLAADETGHSPVLAEDDADEDAVDLDVDDDLLVATGLTQVLSEDLGVETATDIEDEVSEVDATMVASDIGGDEKIEPLPEDAETMLAPLDDEEDSFDFAKTENLPPEAFTENMDMDATGEVPAIAGTDVDLDLDDLTAALKVSEIGDTMAQPQDDATVEQPRPEVAELSGDDPTMEVSRDDIGGDLQEARTMTEVGTKLDLARAYVDMGDPAGAKSILDEVLEEGDEGQKQQAQALLESLPG